MDQYGIFKGLPDRMPFQLGLCPDLSRARDLMNRMNERIPGHYFIRQSILDGLDRMIIRRLPSKKSRTSLLLIFFVGPGQGRHMVRSS